VKGLADVLGVGTVRRHGAGHQRFDKAARSRIRSEGERIFRILGTLIL
jgi:hypothetical protein